MLTAHAEARSQQRSIPAQVIDTLLAYGERQRHRGADVYYLTKSARRRCAGALGATYRQMEKSLNSYVVVSDDGDVITVARRLQRLKF